MHPDQKVARFGGKRLHRLMAGALVKRREDSLVTSHVTREPPSEMATVDAQNDLVRKISLINAVYRPELSQRLVIGDLFISRIKKV